MERSCSGQVTYRLPTRGEISRLPEAKATPGREKPLIPSAYPRHDGSSTSFSFADCEETGLAETAGTDAEELCASRTRTAASLGAMDLAS